MVVAKKRSLIRGRKISNLAVRSSAERGPGRPPKPSDEDLLSRRNSIYDSICSYWCTIGWKLRKARSIQEIRVALSVIENNQWIDRLLVQEKFDVAPDKKLLQKTKTEYASAIDYMVQVNEQHAQEKQLLERLQLALTQVDKRQAARWKRDLHAQKRKTRRLFRMCAQAGQDEIARRQQIKMIESYLACLQALRFVRQRRYSFTPSNLASAIAGVPEISYRRSLIRCSKLEGLMKDHFQYRRFNAIGRLLEKCESSPYKVSTCVRRGIVRMKDDVWVRQDLCDHWHFLKDVLEKTNTKRLLSKERPFVICSAYTARLGAPRGAVDQLFLERDRIVIKK